MKQRLVIYCSNCGQRKVKAEGACPKCSSPFMLLVLEEMVEGVRAPKYHKDIRRTFEQDRRQHGAI